MSQARLGNYLQTNPLPLSRISYKICVIIQLRSSPSAKSVF